MSPVGQQSAFIGGIAAACAGMHAALLGDGAVVDVSIQEALATLAIAELSRAGQTGKSWSRKRVGDGNGATVCILPASDGYAAISPRENRQWVSWLEVMGSPDWGREPRSPPRRTGSPTGTRCMRSWRPGAATSRNTGSPRPLRPRMFPVFRSANPRSIWRPRNFGIGGSSGRSRWSTDGADAGIAVRGAASRGDPAV